MVNAATSFGTVGSPERALAISYALPVSQRPLRALLALDDSLAGVLRTTREPLVGQMRLTWWYDALRLLDLAPPPANPVLHDLHRWVVATGVRGERLAMLVEGWEALLDCDVPDEVAMLTHANARGAALFELAGAVVKSPVGEPLALAGRGWALADLARHLRDRSAAATASALARAALAEAKGMRWSRAGRPLGALALIAQMDIAVPLDAPLPVGAPGRVGRLAWFRLTGR